jgi:hypothetical protein
LIGEVLAIHMPNAEKYPESNLPENAPLQVHTAMIEIL